jgi:hypothetical protein
MGISVLSISVPIGIGRIYRYQNRQTDIVNHRYSSLCTRPKINWTMNLCIRFDPSTNTSSIISVFRTTENIAWNLGRGFPCCDVIRKLPINKYRLSARHKKSLHIYYQHSPAYLEFFVPIHFTWEYSVSCHARQKCPPNPNKLTHF